MRMLVISNRLPVVIENTPTGWRTREASGGLARALGPVLQRLGGIWIGWLGATEVEPDELSRVLAEQCEQAGYELIPLALSKEDVDGFYHGFSNEIIWPLFHDLQTRCNFVPEAWTQYNTVLSKFADVVEQQPLPDDFLWVQDYQLMGNHPEGPAAR